MKKIRVLSFVMALVTLLSAFPLLNITDGLTASAKTTEKKITSFTITPKYKLYTPDPDGNFRYKLFNFDGRYDRYYDLTLYFSDGKKVPLDYDPPLNNGIGVDCASHTESRDNCYEKLSSTDETIMTIKLTSSLSKTNPWKAGKHTVTAKLYIWGKLTATTKFTVNVVKCPTDIKSVSGYCEIGSKSQIIDDFYWNNDIRLDDKDIAEMYTNVKITYKNGKTETVDVYPSKRVKSKDFNFETTCYVDKYLKYNMDFDVLYVNGKTVTALYKGHQMKYVLKRLSAEAPIDSESFLLYVVPGTTGYDICPKGSGRSTLFGSMLERKNSVLKTGMTGRVFTGSKYTIIAIGDLNGDGKITKADATKCLKDASKLNKNKKSNSFYVADVNGDGKITKADSDLLLRTANGKAYVKNWIYNLEKSLY